MVSKLVFAGLFLCGNTYARSGDLQKTKENNSSLEQQTLRWMGHWKGAGAKEGFVRDVLNEFRYLHPEVDIQFAFPEEFLPRKNKVELARVIVKMIESGNIEWDVVRLDPHIYRLVADQLGDWYWGKKHLVDFSKIPVVMQAHKNFIIKSKDSLAYTGDIMAGPYVEGFYYAAWCNKALADRIGITIREYGMTYKDLLEYVCAVHEYNKSAEIPVAAFVEYQDSHSSIRLFYSLLFSALPDFADPECPPEKKNEAVWRVLQAFEALGKYTPLYAKNSAIRRSEGIDLLMNDEALFFFDATWRYNRLKGLYPEKFSKLGLAETPGFSESDHVMGGYISTWAVMKNGAGRNLGIELLEFWSRPYVAEKWVQVTKSPTGLKGSLDDPRYNGDVYAEYQRRLSLNKRVIMDPLMLKNPFLIDELVFDDELIEKLKLVINGELPAQDLYDQIKHKSDMAKKRADTPSGISVIKRSTGRGTGPAIAANPD